MRLLPKSPPTSPRREKNIRQISPRKRRSSCSKGAITAASRNETKQVYHHPTPYELHPVPTAHGYESDDSDAELEQTPSRYDLSVFLQDDVAFDDASNDRYSQVGRRLAMMSNDSDSAQWRSFDEYEMRDPPNAGEDPLQFDREGEDWEDLHDMVDHEGNSISDFRDDARHMGSVTDNAGETIDGDEDGSSISSTVSDTVDDGPRTTSETQGKPAEKPNHLAASLQTNQPGSNPAPVNPRTRSDDYATDRTKPSAQVQADIIQRVTDELNAKKRQDKEKKVSQKSKKGFGLFRRKHDKVSGTTPKIESKLHQEQMQLGQTPATASVPPARNRDQEDGAKQADTQIPRSILKAPSFVSRPDEVEQNPIIANASGNTGVYGFFSNLIGESDGEKVQQGANQDHRAEQESDFLDNLCGIRQIPGEHSDQDRGWSGSKSGGIPDIVYDSRSPTSSRVAASKIEAEEEGMPKRLLDAETLDLQEQDEDGSEQDFKLCASHDNCFRPASALSNSEANGNMTDSNRVFTSRSTVLDEGLHVQNQQYPDDAKDQVLVQCLRDSDCNGLANCIVKNVDHIDTLGCTQTYEFMDDFMTAENPHKDESGAKPVMGARALSLDNENSRERSKGRKKRHDADVFGDDPHDLPIKEIEIPMQFFDQESASASSGSRSNYTERRKSGLYVDTRLEDEMRQMQEELEGKKKRSLFSRMKRVSDHKNKSRNQD